MEKTPLPGMQRVCVRNHYTSSLESWGLFQVPPSPTVGITKWVWVGRDFGDELVHSRLVSLIYTSVVT